LRSKGLRSNPAGIVDSSFSFAVKLRLISNVLVSNSDDHLRNHGFILVPGRGWRLSGAYDVNPMPDSRSLKLNISEVDNAMDLDLVHSVAPYFRVTKSDSGEIIKRCKSIVAQWQKIAVSLKLSERERERMAPAFRLAG
jgi:serine/threonine-protein kinase HipA